MPSKNKIDELVESLILLELKHAPNGLTTRQIQHRVRKKLKLIKKYKKIEKKLQNTLDKILE